MNPLLVFIYRFLKLLTKVSLRIYYPKATMINLHYLKYRGASILVSNHPNTLVDPLNAAARVPKIVHFLAMVRLFQTPFGNWLFSTFFCIPIERPQDTQGKPINNKAAFAKSNAFLASGGCLYVAPEGDSEMERRVRPFKTGTARIALGAEAAQDFQLGLRILPVGLSYDAPGQFRSRMYVYAGKPIEVRDYADAYRKGSTAAARQLTKDLEAKVRSQAIDTLNVEEDRAVLRMECLLRNSAPLPGEAHFHRTKQLIARYREWEQDAPGERSAFDSRLQAYFEQLDALRSSDRSVARPLRYYGLHIIGLSFLVPVFLYGWLNNLLPAGIPYWTEKRLNLYPGYRATVRILTGLLSFPVFYALQTALVSLWAISPWAWIYLLSLPLAGWLAWQYQSWWRRVRAFLQVRNKIERSKLEKERAWLLEQINSMLSR